VTAKLSKVAKFREFGQLLRSLRIAAGLTEAQVADFAGVAQRSVSTWELGKAFPNDPALIARVAELFDPDCTRRVELDLLRAAGAIRECALRPPPSEHSSVERVFEAIPVEWTDRLAEVIADRVASRIAAALQEERSLFAARSERVEELFLQAMRSQQEITRLVAELLRALQPRVAEAPAREPQQPD
jgi:transcriptional regulator with XRE-family HTH domain